MVRAATAKGISVVKRGDTGTSFQIKDNKMKNEVPVPSFQKKEGDLYDKSI